MDTCQYAQNCPQPPHNSLPFTGGTMELVLLVGFAVACVALGLLIRYSRGAE